MLAPPKPSKRYEESYRALKLLASSIQQWFGKPKRAPRVDVFIEPGCQIDVGQQFNLVLQIPEKYIRDTLFRVYLSPEGEVRFDFCGEDYVTCDSVEQMQKAVEAFLSEPEVRSRMRVYKDLVSS